MQVVVVDNASQDESVRQAEAAGADSVIRNPANFGFGRGVNQGYSALSGMNCVVLLNPDVQLVAPVEPLLEAALRDGAACGMLEGDDGKPQTGFQIRRLPRPIDLVFEVLGINRLWKLNPVNRYYRCIGQNLMLEAKVEQPAGAFLVVSVKAWTAAGGFDECFYPVWFEDVDFCKRLRDNGFSINFLPSVRARHLGGHSVTKMPYSSRVTTWYGSLLKYGQKHFSSAALRMIAVSVLLGAGPRCFAGILKERSRKPIAVWFYIGSLCLSIIIFGRTDDFPSAQSGLITGD